MASKDAPILDPERLKALEQEALETVGQSKNGATPHEGASPEEAAHFWRKLAEDGTVTHEEIMGQRKQRAIR